MLANILVLKQLLRIPSRRGGNSRFQAEDGLQQFRWYSCKQIEIINIGCGVASCLGPNYKI